MDPVSAEPPRVLFCSYHALVDPSSGAALATRDLLHLLARRGLPTAALCGPRLDFEQPRPLEDVLHACGLPFQLLHRRAGTASFDLFHFIDDGVPVSGFRPAAGPAPDLPATQAAAFLDLLDGVADRFRPDVLLTYGGDDLAALVIARARRHGLPVVFALHNFAYHDAAIFRGVDAVLVPSEFARDHYRRTLGLECVALPGCLDWDRVLCPEVRPRYATFVNPQPDKGVFWFARLAHELNRLRPDIPLLVVEGRGGTDWLSATGLDLGGLTNLHRMANTPDPRHFYAVSRAVLMPSLWRESFGRVAAEALVNGIPVLASNRGALPETLRGAGLLFDIPARYTPESRQVPSAAEVRPWVDALVRLWDDPAFYERTSRRCREAAAAYRPERLGPAYEAFFRQVAGRALGRGTRDASPVPTGPD
jgi:glycosyltransferase involved in cell wall biosynthesis